jgi:hypothetical protein
MRNRLYYGDSGEGIFRVLCRCVIYVPVDSRPLAIIYPVHLTGAHVLISLAASAKGISRSAEASFGYKVSGVVSRLTRINSQIQGISTNSVW